MYRYYVPTAGSPLKRNHETRCVQGTRWICKNNDCHNIIHLNDDTLLKETTHLLNTIIKNPDLIKEDNGCGVISNETVRIENEIRKILEHGKINKDSITEMIFRNASIKYSNINSINHITGKAEIRLQHKSAFSFFIIAILKNSYRNNP